jgi:hypothetical protein
MKAKYSGKDSKGKIYIDCSECERGGNGSDPDKCSCGANIKKGKKGMCFMGDLMDKYDPL